MLKFRQSQRRAAEDIQEALAAGDHERAHRIAHTVRGIAGSIGATELQAAAATVEAGFRSQNPGRFEAGLSAFEAALSRVVSSIASFAEAEAEMPPSEPLSDLAAIVPKLSHLESLLKNDDFDARNIIEELLPYFQRTRHAGLFEILTRKVAGYDFEGALAEFQIFKAAIVA